MNYNIDNSDWDLDPKEANKRSLEKYYGKFSDNVRHLLQSKNLVSPKNIYDVFYPSVRANLLSKNIIVNTNITDANKIIRDNLIKQNVKQQIDLLSQDENFR